MADVDKLVAVYIKIRDAKIALQEKQESDMKVLTDQLEAIESALLEVCKSTGQEGGKTTHGTFTRSVKTRYWTSNWDSLYSLIKEFNDPMLLEQRIHQSNFKTFLKEHPDRMPAGMNVEAKYSITVRRSKN